MNLRQRVELGLDHGQARCDLHELLLLPGAAPHPHESGVTRGRPAHTIVVVGACSIEPCHTARALPRDAYRILHTYYICTAHEDSCQSVGSAYSSLACVHTCAAAVSRSATTPALDLPGCCHPQFRGKKNRRDIGKSQSIWSASKMETDRARPSPSAVHSSCMRAALSCIMATHPHPPIISVRPEPARGGGGGGGGGGGADGLVVFLFLPPSTLNNTLACVETTDLELLLHRELELLQALQVCGGFLGQPLVRLEQRRPQRRLQRHQPLLRLGAIKQLPPPTPAFLCESGQLHGLVTQSLHSLQPLLLLLLPPLELWLGHRAVHLQPPAALHARVREHASPRLAQA
jgi:hypothetical protein